MGKSFLKKGIIAGIFLNVAAGVLGVHAYRERMGVKNYWEQQGYKVESVEITHLDKRVWSQSMMISNSDHKFYSGLRVCDKKGSCGTNVDSTPVTFTKTWPRPFSILTNH